MRTPARLNQEPCVACLGIAEGIRRDKKLSWTIMAAVRKIGARWYCKEHADFISPKVAKIKPVPPVRRSGQKPKQ